MTPLAIYIHWPFCLSKCPYCDFNSRPLKEGIEESLWLETYKQELSFYAMRLPEREISSIYFGGGTPSLMSAAMVEGLVNHIARLWPLCADIEVTLEANPSSAEEEKFRAFKSAGITRLSVGVQSFNDETLRFLGRAHNARAACLALEGAAQVFDRFSLDLIYAWQGQTYKSWANELETALSFSPRHLSCYQLTVEKGSLFFKHQKQKNHICDDETAAQLYALTQEITTKAGVPSYEISNHAVPGQESRHNLTYWKYRDYVGIGPGAQGRFFQEARRATENEKNPERWLTAVAERKTSATETVLTLEDAQKEALLMGLRLTAGIKKAAWKQTLGTELDGFLSPDKRAALRREGLLEETADTLRVTDEGRLKLNAVLTYLLVTV